MPRLKEALGLYIILCFVGAALEWVYGTLWSLLGEAPWIYPNSIFRYTSLEVLPLWGLGGLISIAIYRAYTGRSLRLLLNILPPLALAVLWVWFFSAVIQ